MSLRNRSAKDSYFDNNTEDDDEYESNPIKKTIKKFDLHPKIKPSVRNESVSNTPRSKYPSNFFVSLFLVFVIFIVIWEESTIYFKPITEDFMMVDTDFNEKLAINLDISFYKLKCDEISVDAVDFNGEQQIGVEHEIFKLSRGDKGQDLGLYTKVTDLRSSQGETYLPPGYCGSCYGAAPMDNEVECCNTCEELKRQFVRFGRDASLAESTPQCQREKKYGALPDEFGCRIRGTLVVNKMEGNFHVAAGFSHPQKHQDHAHHIHHINRTTISNFDISHHIHHLSFGEVFFPGQDFPLDNTDYIAPGLGNLVYYIQLVPTVYETIYGERAHTNQFSGYAHYTSVDITKSHYKLPGIFFKYEFDPMRITYVERTKSFFQFLIRVCAILGGIYAVLKFTLALLSVVISFRSKDAAQSFNDIFGS